MQVKMLDRKLPVIENQFKCYRNWEYYLYCMSLLET